MNVNIEISDIALDGINFSKSQSLELRQAMKSELTGMATSQLGVSIGLRSDAIGAAGFESAPTSSPRELASGIAHAIRQSMDSQQR